MTLIKLVDSKPNMIKDSLKLGLRYILEILGHKSSKTIVIYTNASTKSIGKIESPLDSLNLGEKGVIVV